MTSGHSCDPSCNHGSPQSSVDEAKQEFQEARRSFLKDALAVGGTSVSVGALGISMTPNAFAQNATSSSGRANHYYVPATDKTVHWGYFSRSLKPLVEVESG